MSTPTPPPSPPTTHDDTEAVRLFLIDRDAPCPRCHYNLRGNTTDICPECGHRFALYLGVQDPRTAWDVVALIAVSMTTLYFGFRAIKQIITLAANLLAGPTLASLRADIILTTLVELSIAILGLWWCVTIFRHHARRPRPIWARPTTAAAGLLLAVFVAFLIAYGIRGVG